MTDPVNPHPPTAAQFIPPWMDKQTLAKHLCMSERGVDVWAATGIIPPARKRGGKLMWRWVEVDEWLTFGKPSGGPDDQAERRRREIRQEAGLA